MKETEEGIEDKRMCGELKRLDREYQTSRRSPLHHDNRYCPIHGKEMPRDPYGVHTR